MRRETLQHPTLRLNPTIAHPALVLVAGLRDEALLVGVATARQEGHATAAAVRHEVARHHVLRRCW